jgi:hypothetical protein
MTSVAEEAPRYLSRAVFPVRMGAAVLTSKSGTAFLFNHLIPGQSTTEGPEKVLEFLVTSRSVAAGRFAAIGLRRHLVHGSASDEILFSEWSDLWSHPSDPAEDVAFMPFSGLRSHAERKGWSWNTQEATVGMMLKVGEKLDVYRGELIAFGYEAHGDGPRAQPLRLEQGPTGITVAGATAASSGSPVIALSAVNPAATQLRFVLVGMVGSVPPDAQSDGETPLGLTLAPTILAGAADVYDRISRA